MSLEILLRSKIAERIIERRKTLALTQDDFVDSNGREIQRNVINFIENKKVFGKNTSFISDRNLNILSDVLKVSEFELIFGSEQDINNLVRYIYDTVAYNLFLLGDIPWNDRMGFYINLTDVTKEFREVMLFSGRFSFYWTLNEMELRQGAKESDPFNFFEYEKKQYDLIVEHIWENTSINLVQSFKKEFTKSEVSFKKLDKKIMGWLKGDFISLMKNFKQELEKDPILSIGFQVRKMLVMARENIMDMLIIAHEASSDEDTVEKMYPFDYSRELSHVAKYKLNSKVDSLKLFRRLVRLEEIYVNNARALVEFQDKYMPFEQDKFHSKYKSLKEEDFFK